MVRGDTLVTWGERTMSYALPALKAAAVWMPKVEVATLVDGDVIGIDGQGLARFDGRTGARHRIDDGVETGEIVPVELHGRRGVILIHKGQQVRFYELPSGAMTELYSFYSPSLQSGLLVRDIDRDGRVDIIAGNYWMRNPESFDLHWRLFAIRTWSEERLSANSVFAMPDDETLWVAQSGMSNARLARFRRPPRVTDQWIEERMEGSLVLDHPAGLVAWGTGVVVGEREGKGRVMLIGVGRPRVLAETRGVVLLHALRGGRLLVVDRERPFVITP